MVQSILFALSTGVISGVIAAVLIFVGLRYWNRVIVPWYEDRVYLDIKIAGDWETTGQEHGETFHEAAKVEQNAHRVWGEITYKTESEFIQYEFEGEFRNLLLTARYWVKADNNLDRGTFTLMLKNNGRTLKGFYAWYLDDDNDVISDSYEWTRV